MAETILAKGHEVAEQRVNTASKTSLSYLLSSQLADAFSHVSRYSVQIPSRRTVGSGWLMCVGGGWWLVVGGTIHQGTSRYGGKIW